MSTETNGRGMALEDERGDRRGTTVSPGMPQIVSKGQAGGLEHIPSHRPQKEPTLLTP